MNFEEEIKKYKDNPNQYEARVLHEDDALLKEFGISIQGRENLPEAFFKLYPSDFIVEEISQNGSVCTIDSQDQNEIQNGDSVGSWEAVLVKSNIGTHDVAIEIANKLSIAVDTIQYAGLKDEFAITAQKIIINGVKGSDLNKISSSNYFLKEIKSTTNILKKGGLQGNRFTITLRFPLGQEGKVQEIDKAVDRVVTKGFFNFYYLQRFGLPRLNNHYIASLLLHADYKGAVFAHLTDIGKSEIKEEMIIRASAAELFENWKELKKLFVVDAKAYQYELEVINYLIDRPHDYKGAIRSIPHIVMLWVYSLSSWMFNAQLSFISEKSALPKKLPLFLSNSQKDLKMYKYFINKLMAYPPNFQAIKEVMPALDLRSRYIDTTAKVTFNQVKKITGGIIISFDLGKGSYATTLLSHLVNLVSYAPPTDINFEPINAKLILGTGNIVDLYSKLEGINRPVFTLKSARI